MEVIENRRRNAWPDMNRTLRQERGRRGIAMVPGVPG
jgi:hypothetical protein